MHGIHDELHCASNVYVLSKGAGFPAMLSCPPKLLNTRVESTFCVGNNAFLSCRLGDRVKVLQNLLPLSLGLLLYARNSKTPRRKIKCHENGIL